ncbi:MAG: hypothetical protein V8S08_03165 [Lachnoclostridium sp.]
MSEHSIATLPRGRAKVFDEIREELLQKAPGAKIETIEEYSIRSMNDCSMKQQLVLMVQNQIAHYPFFTFRPLNTTQKVNFGIYYKKHDEKMLTDFFKKIEAEN